MARTAGGDGLDSEGVGRRTANIGTQSSPPPAKAANPSRSLAVSELAARQHGRVSRAQLVALGVPLRTIRNHVASGRLHIEHRGVYAVGHAGRTRRGAEMAAVLACGPGAVLSHQSAGALHGLLRWDGRPHVTAARSRGEVQRVVVHRSRRLEPADTTVVDGLPATTWARTIVDLADTLPTARIVRLLEEAVMADLYDEHELASARERACGRRGERRLRAAIALGHHRRPQRTRSPLEERFLDLVRSAAPPLPASEFNCHVDAGDETFEVDVLFGDARLIVELDSRRHHGHQRARERDLRRDQLLGAAGFAVIRLTWRDVTRRREATLRRLRATSART